MSLLSSRTQPPDSEPPSLFRAFSTDDVPAPSRRDYWIAHAFRSVEPVIADGPAFYGNGLTYGGSRGQFVHCESAPLDTVLTQQRLRKGLSDEHVAICLIHAGEYRVEQSDGVQLSFGSGALFMFDCGQPMRSQWSESRVSYLRLPRLSVSEALGQDPSCLGRIALELNHARLAPFLIAQLTALDSYGSTLRSGELNHVLDASINLAHYLLRAEFVHGAYETESSGRSRLQCAYQYIEQNLHRHDLDPEQIARAVHCSRTQLYRLFGTQPRSVKETVREARLRKSLYYLEESGPTAGIGEIAYACGFADQSAFGKLFRQRFGMTPGEMRRMKQCDSTCELAAAFAKPQQLR